MQTCPNCGEENPARFRLCGFCGTPLAPALPPREIRKTVTIVFTDLKGSTDLGEKLDSESLREVMTRYFDAMRAELEYHGGTIEKYIGDAIMAVFGLPTLHEDDALRAVRAAHGMRGILEGLNDELERTWGVRLAMRTGVNTGEVVAGDPTTGQRLVTGDAVNTAARLEQAAPTNEVLLGDLTLHLVRDDVEVVAVEPLALKGKAEPVPAWRLLDVKADRPLAISDEGPMVGRDDEMRRLRDTFRKAVSDRSLHSLTLIGDAGVGKSRLTRAFLASLDDTLVVHGRCLPYGKGNTFWPVVEIVRDAAAIDEDDPPQRAVTKITGLVGDTEVAERLASASSLISTTYPITEMFWAVRRLLEILAEHGPIVVVVDDIHWAEPTLLDLLDHLGNAGSAIPCLLLASARHELLETRPRWAEGTRQSRIVLEPLGEAQSSTLVDTLLGRSGLGPAVRRLVTEAAEGNPLFVQQFVSMLVDRRTNGNGEHDRGEADELADISIPPTIQALLAARLDQLKNEERVVVEHASVIGMRFAESAVRFLAPEPLRPTLDEHLAVLDRKQFVHPVPSSDEGSTHRFHHHLVRDTTYGSLLKRTRAELHERFVEWADERNAGSDRALGFEEILGYHLEQAHHYLSDLGPLDQHGLDLGVRASVLLATAGRRAFARGDMPATANLMHRAALTRPVGDPERASLLVEAGEAMIQAGEIDFAEGILETGRQEAAAIEEWAIETTARIALGYLRYMTHGDVPETEMIADVRSAIATLEEAGDERGLSKAWRLLTNVYFAGCRYLDATETAERMVEHARRAGDRAMELRSLPGLAYCAQMGPMPVPQAIEVVRGVLAEMRSDRQSEAQALRALANLEAMSGDIEAARALYRRSRATLEELGWRFHAALTSTIASGPVELIAEDAETAEAELRRDYEALAAMGESNYITTTAALLAEALYRQGRDEEAMALTEESERMAAPDDVASQFLWRSVRAKLHARAGRIAEAEPMSRQAVEIIEAAQDPDSQGYAYIDLAEVLRMAGRHDEAAGAAGEAVARFERKGNVASAARARRLLDEIHAAAAGT